MIQKLNLWLESIFGNSDINKLMAVGAVVALFLWFFADEITPFFGAVLIAYLLESGVQWLERMNISRTKATSFVVLLAVTVLIVFLFLSPLLFLQLRGFADDLPNIITVITSAGYVLKEYLPTGFTPPAEHEVVAAVNDFMTSTGKYLLENSLGFAGNVFSLFLYLVLFPLLVFFLLKDKLIILRAVQHYTPKTPIFGELWASVDEQFGSYVRGKFIEAGIIGFLSWLVFNFGGLNYAFFISALVGLSVFVPFVGAIAVTIPVLLLVYVQFGFDSTFFWIIGLYTLIHTFDGQILVPLLFSEVVKLHPVAIFVAIIFFGNLWGVWGVFFAIPLASIIKSLLLVIDARRTI